MASYERVLNISSRILLILLNLILITISLILVHRLTYAIHYLTHPIWIQNVKAKHLIYAELFQQLHIDVVLLMIVTLIIILAAALGILAAGMSHHLTPIISYIVCLSVVCIASIVIGTLIQVDMKWSLQKFSQGFRDKMKTYYNNTDDKLVIDEFQRRFECCGYYSYEDYDELLLPIPPSCFIFKWNCDLIEPEPDLLFEDGCERKMELYLWPIFAVIGYFSLGVGIVQLLSIIYASALAYNTKTRKVTELCVLLKAVKDQKIDELEKEFEGDSKWKSKRQNKETDKGQDKDKYSDTYKALYKDKNSDTYYAFGKDRNRETYNALYKDRNKDSYNALDKDRNRDEDKTGNKYRALGKDKNIDKDKVQGNDKNSDKYKGLGKDKNRQTHMPIGKDQTGDKYKALGRNKTQGNNKNIDKYTIQSKDSNIDKDKIADKYKVQGNDKNRDKYILSKDRNIDKAFIGKDGNRGKDRNKGKDKDDNNLGQDPYTSGTRNTIQLIDLVNLITKEMCGESIPCPTIQDDSEEIRSGGTVESIFQPQKQTKL